MIGRHARWARLVTAAVVGCLVLTGCNGLLDSVNLPGGSTKGPAYSVNIIFDDVMHLQPQMAVRVNDVPVGDVKKITLDGWKAKVEVTIRKDVVLPKNAFAELRQTSIFGEKFVSLGPPPPPEQPVGRLKNGDTITRSGRNPETEEVLAALSALLNGGGLEQLQTISVELSNALAGREDSVRDALRQLDRFVGALDDHKQQIIRALDAINNLSISLNNQKRTIEAALDNIPQALAVLADQRVQLTTMLRKLSDLGATGSQIIRASRNDTVTTIQKLQPILANLDKAKGSIVGSLDLMLNYPFPPTAVNGIHGDYAGLYLTLDLDLQTLLQGLASPQNGSGCQLPQPLCNFNPPINGLSGGGNPSSTATTPPSNSTQSGGSSGGSPLNQLVPQSDYTAIMVKGDGS